MKLKRLLTTLIASATLFSFSNTSEVIAGGCDNAPDTGTVFKWTGPGSWKILTTVRQPLTSNNERKVEFAYKKLDLKAQRELARFVSVNVKTANKLTEDEKETFVVGANDEMSEDALEGFNQFLDEFESSTDELLVGSIEIGRCHSLGKEVRLTRGINSENAVGAQLLKNQDFGGNANGINSNSPTRTYQRNVDQGYSGYGNLDDF